MSGIPLKYSKPFVVLHWLAATAVIANLTVGLIFADMPRGPERYALYRLHTSLGVAVLLLGIALVLLRIGRKVPPLPIEMPLWMRIAAKASHDLLYTLIVLIPLAGWLMVSVSAGVHGISFFGLEWPAFPYFAGMAHDPGREYREAFETLHVVAAFGMISLIPVHVGAALYHQYWRRDGVLARMVPWIK